MAEGAWLRRWKDIFREEQPYLFAMSTAYALVCYVPPDLKLNYGTASYIKQGYGY